MRSGRQIENDPDVSRQHHPAHSAPPGVQPAHPVHPTLYPVAVFHGHPSYMQMPPTPVMVPMPVSVQMPSMPMPMYSTAMPTAMSTPLPTPTPTPMSTPAVTPVPVSPPVSPRVVKQVPRQTSAPVPPNVLRPVPPQAPYPGNMHMQRAIPVSRVTAGVDALHHQDAVQRVRVASSVARNKAREDYDRQKRTSETHSRMVQAQQAIDEQTRLVSEAAQQKRKLVWQSYEKVSESNRQKLHIDKLRSDKKQAEAELEKLKQKLVQAKVDLIKARSEATSASLNKRGLANTFETRKRNARAVFELRDAIKEAEKDAKANEKSAKELRAKAEEFRKATAMLDKRILDLTTPKTNDADDDDLSPEAQRAFDFLFASGKVDYNLLVRLKRVITALAIDMEQMVILS